MTTPLAQCLELPCGLSLSNRIVKTALSENLAADSHVVSNDLLKLYRIWATSGAGLLVVGDVMVDHRYLKFRGDLVLDADARTEADLAELANVAKSGGAKAILQLTHPGLQASAGLCRRPVGPSATRRRDVRSFCLPVRPGRKLTADEIINTIQKYASAAQCAEEAGFDGVMVQAGQGDLISQFLSPRWNRRKDDWGGSAYARRQFLIEVIRAVRNRVRPEFAVGVKLNISDLSVGGFDFEACQDVVDCLAAEAVDLIELTAGSYSQPYFMGLWDKNFQEKHSLTGGSQSLAEPGFLEYVRKLKDRTLIPVLVTEAFAAISDMHVALERRYVDLVGFDRTMCLDPDLPVKLLGPSSSDGSMLPSFPRILPESLMCVPALRKFEARSRLRFCQRRIKRISCGD